jgi:hypothetical protein
MPIVMSRNSFLVGAIVAAVLAMVLGAAAIVALRPPDGAVPSVAQVEGPPAARISIPNVGDCGDHDGPTVTPVVCSDRTADVVVADRLVIGDPQALCPLFDRTSVLATTAGESLTICWVPQGGGPERRFGPARLRGAISVQPVLDLGVCGDVHDQHVHSPLACDDGRADGVVLQVVEAGEDAAACPGTTVLATVDDQQRWICWGPNAT